MTGEFLEREGGQVAACLFLVAWATAMLSLNIPEGKEVLVFALGVLSRSMMDPAKKSPPAT